MKDGAGWSAAGRRPQAADLPGYGRGDARRIIYHHSHQQGRDPRTYLFQRSLEAGTKHRDLPHPLSTDKMRP